jgi:polyisoprenyl-phosphate glycosyltransferase
MMVATESRAVEECAPDYSVVMPVYCNEGLLRPTLESFMVEVRALHPQLTCEVIFVDDGSEDGSLEELLRLRDEHPGVVKVIRLTRNFGQPSARLAGLMHARGRWVVSMSADGQDPMHLINDMMRAHVEEHYEVVICHRRGRDESASRIVASRIFFFLMRKLSFPQMPSGGFDYVLLGRRALEAILRNQEAHPYFQGQVLWVGFTPKFIPYRRRERTLGRSRWTFARKITLLIDGVLNYSFFPIRLISLLGIVAGLFGFFLAAAVAVRRIFWGTNVEGWAGVVVITLVMGGIQLLTLGVIGEYLWRTLAQTRNRDQFIVDRIYD